LRSPFRVPGFRLNAVTEPPAGHSAYPAKTSKRLYFRTVMNTPILHPRNGGT